MKAEIKQSKQFDVPYVHLEKEGMYICGNGVGFTDEEYAGRKETGLNMKSEFEKRSKEGTLFDFDYAVKTGKVRHKVTEGKEGIPSERETGKVAAVQNNGTPKSVMAMCIALAVTSLGSMYISTVHTATYLFDYVDIVSAWVMSAVITVYCSTAFEVVILFKEKRHFILSSVFALLWSLVVVFSMVTTVSVFYDRYSFNKIEIAEDNRESDSARLSLELLKQQEKDLREEIDFKKRDIEYRRSKDYATNTRTLELNRLQSELQSNLDRQKEIISFSPEATKAENETRRKENLFDFFGKVFHINGDIIQFIMSTLSAVFINLISPFSVTVVISLTGGLKDKIPVLDRIKDREVGK